MHSHKYRTVCERGKITLGACQFPTEGLGLKENPGRGTERNRHECTGRKMGLRRPFKIETITTDHRNAARAPHMSSRGPPWRTYRRGIGCWSDDGGDWVAVTLLLSGRLVVFPVG